MTVIRRPQREELETLGNARDAARVFAAIGMPEIGLHEPFSIVELEVFRGAGRASVTVDAQDRPPAFPLTALVDDCAHVGRSASAPRARDEGSEPP